MRRSFFASAFTAGLIAGTLDIIAACINTYIKNPKVTPTKVLNYIASGAFDPKSYSSPMMQTVSGLLIHFFIAISFTFLFFLLSKQFPSLVKYPIPIGILYGILVWAAMRFIILAYLSRHTQKPIVKGQDYIDAAISAGILVVCIGIPVAFLAKRYIRTNT